MFTAEERNRLRTQLLERGGSDGRIAGVAITGSAAAAREDVWSDIDLAFVVETEFRAMGPECKLVSGSARTAMPVAGPATGYLIGFGWLYALHARSSIARGKLWQAEYMISGMRDTALSLACVRHGLPASLGRGLDGLPGDVSGAFADSLVRGIDAAELARAYVAAVRVLMVEIRLVDAGVAARLEVAMAQLAETRFAPSMG